MLSFHQAEIHDRAFEERERMFAHADLIDTMRAGLQAAYIRARLQELEEILPEWLQSRRRILQNPVCQHSMTAHGVW
jgi:hypothetical protein